MDKLTELLIEHEGLRLFVYKDTMDKDTIGVGRNLSDRGIRQDEAMYMLANDLKESRAELSHYDWYNSLDEVRQDVLVELHFNIGLSKLLGFHQTLLAIENKDFAAAAMHLLNSQWAQQVGKERSQNMADRLHFGHY